MPRQRIRIIRRLIVSLGLIGISVLLVIVASGNRPIVANLLSDVRAADNNYISWVEHLIDDQALSGGIELRGADGLEMADLDGDGFLDIVSVHEDKNHIRLAFGSNDSDQWDSYTLAQGDWVEGVEDPALGDINGDGHIDILVAVEGGSIIYFENPGDQVRTMDNWQSAVPTVSKGTGSWIKVYLADFNQDGKLEAVATNKSIKMHAGYGSMEVPESPVSWFEIPADPLDENAWIEHPMGYYRVPVNSQPVDIDGDGDLDVIAGSRGEARMILFRNDSTATEIKFTEHAIDVNNRSVPATPVRPKMLSGMVMAFADLNQDQRLDIVTFEASWRIVWLEQPHDLSMPWEIHTIGKDYPDSPIALTLFDINEDGRLDLLTGGYSQDPRDHDVENPGLMHRGAGLWWLEQPENVNATWIRHNISRRSRGMFDILEPMDMNKDGLMDFVGTRGNSSEFDGVFWLEQRRTPNPEKVFSQARASESEQLALPPIWIRKLPEWVLSRMSL